jgi:hypothetical protein
LFSFFPLQSLWQEAQSFGGARFDASKSKMQKQAQRKMTVTADVPIDFPPTLKVPCK